MASATLRVKIRIAHATRTEVKSRFGKVVSDGYNELLMCDNEEAVPRTVLWDYGDN